jgi:hypothetical protein
MIETPLFCEGTDFVVSAPEVTYEDSSEHLPQNLFVNGGSPAFGNEIIAEFFGGKTPQPVGHPI